METGEEATAVTPYPPEGVEWHNRWAELENAYALLEKQNQSLQNEVSDLKGALHEKLQEPPGTEDTELRQKLQEQVDLLLTEEVRKEEKIARFAKELEDQTGKMSELSRAKFQLEYEKSRMESEILPIKAERDRLQSEKQMKDRIIDDLRKELASSREEQEKLFREKFEMTRDLRRQLQAEKAAASYQQQMAEEALQAQYREKKLKEELERKVKDLQEDFANKKASLEDQRRISEDRAQRMDENWKTAQAQLAETVADLKSACEVRDETAMELQVMKSELEEQRQQYQRLSQEHEDFLRRRIPGADTGELPNGFESLTELVRIANTSRQEALQERAAKENLQKVLQDIEREIRQRYPVLMSQNQELKELRAQNAEMKEQNRIIYQKAREYATYNRDAEARAQRAEHAYTIADLHAHDLTKQLAILLHDKNRWSNASLAASRATFFQMTKAAEEEGEWPLSSVQDVVQQNVALRKALRQLEVRCQEEDAKEKEAMEDREQQLEGELEKKAEELQDLTSQLQELKDTVEDVSQHRDAALRKVKTLEAAQASLPPNSTGSAAGAAPVPAEDPAKLQRLAAREEELRSQVLELQKSGSKASCDLATTEAKLEFERQRRSDAEENSKQLKRELKEVQERVNQQAKFIEDLREEKCIEERKLRESQHALQTAQSSKGEVESMLKAEESKVSTLEKSHAVLQTEKQLLEREVAALQVRTSQERESLKKDLEEQYKKQEDLVLNLSKKSQEDMQRLEATLRESREQAAQAAQLAKEEQIVKLEAKLAAAQREIELRRSGRSSAEVVAEAETQLDRSEHMMDQLLNPEQRGDVRLAQVAEREEQHRKTVETWKKLLAQQSAELRESKAEQERLEEEVNSLKAKFQEEREKIEEDSQRDKVKASELAVRLDETRSEVLGLKSQVEASNVELETAKLDSEQKLRDSTEQLSVLERERKDLQDQVQKAEQKYQEEVKLHATDAKELGSAHERLSELDRSCLQLKHQVADLERETLRAREERKEELSSVRKRMEQAERHAENLSEENARYRDQMVALSRGESSEVSSAVLLEMKQARELGEVERRKLELQKTQIEGEAKAVRAENQSLREQLANEQRENWRLQKDCQLETQSRAKLLQIDMIEDENCRLEAENKIMKSKLEEAEKKADATTNPLVEQLEVAKKRTGEVESELKLLKSKASEWKSMYEACKFKEDDIKKWEVQQAELKSNVTSLEEKISSLQGKLEEEQKICKEEKSKIQDLTKARDELQGTLKAKEAEFNKQASALKAVQGIKELHTRRLHELEAETKKLKEENQRHKEPEEVKQLQKRVHELEAETKKLKEENQRHKEPEEVKQLQKRVHELEAEGKKMKEENQRLKDPEEVKQLQRHADTALHLAMEYRTAMEVLLPEVEKRADAARPIAPAAAAPATAPATAPGTAPATTATNATAASPQKDTTAQKETSSVESKDAAKEAKRPAVPGALGQATAQPKPAQPAAPEARTAAPPAATTTTTSVVPPATPVVPKESPESAPAKRKEQPVQQPGQVERAAKTARSEGPPVKKQPVPAKAPAASGGAPASTTTAAGATPPTTPAPSPALTPRAAPIEIMDVDEEPPKPSS